MHGFVRNLITEWRRLDLPFAGSSVVVAVSGGADSVSLLLAMDDLFSRKKIEHRIIAAHLNHGLREAESDADESFVRELATRLGVQYVCERRNVEQKGNLEQNARTARYEFLHRTARENQAFAVLTGHTVNDQAETFLMNLIRGSGIDGLTAMPSIRRMGAEATGENESARTNTIENLEFEISDMRSQIKLIRPMLGWAKRSETEAFCVENEVEFRNDAMNDEVEFKRVRIRKELIPMLETMNPKIVETLAATAGLMGGRNTSIQFNIPAELKISELRSLNEGELFERLRSWLRHHRGNTRGLGLKHIKAVAQLVLSEKSGRIVELPGGNASRSGGKLLYQKN